MIWVTVIFGLLGLLLEWLLARKGETLPEHQRSKLNQLIARMNAVKNQAVWQGCSPEGEARPLMEAPSDDELRDELMDALTKAIKMPNFIVDAETKRILKIVLALAEASDATLMSLLDKVRKEL